MIQKIQHETIQKMKDKRVFIDANILLYIFWPTGNRNWSKEYSSAFKILMSNQISLVIDRTTLSEFINRALRHEYEKHFRESNQTKSNLPFKEFRNETYGLETIREVYSIVKEKILSKIEFLDKKFNKDEIIELLKDEKGDFNDNIIIQFCKESNLILLTNDGDYKNAPIDILTANPVLLLN